MSLPVELLKCLANAVRETVDTSVLSDFIVEATPELAQAVWGCWDRGGDTAHKRAELEALASADPEQVEEAVSELLTGPKNGPTVAIDMAMIHYLTLLPSAIRRFCRRPSQPGGTVLPASLALQSPADLLPLLPTRMSWFKPGDRPWNIGDWEVIELIEGDQCRETWKARNPHQADAAPTALQFFLQPAAKEYFLGAGAELLDRVLLQGKHPGLVELQQLHVYADPPCLQYEYVEAPDLAALVREWQETQTPPVLRHGTELILQLADILVPLHQLQPPLVHGDLRPANILITGAGSTGWTCKIAGLGLGPLIQRLALRERDAGRGDSAVFPRGNLYTSPEQLQGASPTPRDDVFALGVLWYQLLTANLAAARPGGSLWRRKLAEQGLSTGLIELLESCFEDEPAQRPADAAVLAAHLRDSLQSASTILPNKPTANLETPPKPPATPAAESEGSGKVRVRRADVWQLFDTLGQAEPPRSKLVTNAIGLKLVLIPAGTFVMGSPDEEEGRRVNEGPRHEVLLTSDFYLGVYPVTQEQYQQVMGNNPSRYHPGNGGRLAHPVETVTWEDAVEFCRRLSALPAERQARRAYRLPTEAEWEYACRAGTTTPFACGPALGLGQANCDTNFPYGGGQKGLPLQKTSAVGAYPANNFGLYDMHGNVWEWCIDWLGDNYYRQSPKRDPQGPTHGHFRVLRGGSWRNHACTCRAAYRNGLAPVARDMCTGFRVLMALAS